MLEANNLCRSFGNLQILKDICLHIYAGEVVALLGASGAGKSTLLHILATLDTPDSGYVILNNINTGTLHGSELAKFRNQNIGFIFQAYSLLPEFNALENVCLPGYIGGISHQKATKRGEELLHLLGLQSRMHHMPHTLSGGEQQRVAIARALFNCPKVVLADEPSGNLDTKNAEALHNLFLTLRNELGITFIIATHNPEFAKASDRSCVLQDGLLQDDLPRN